MTEGRKESADGESCLRPPATTVQRSGQLNAAVCTLLLIVFLNYIWTICALVRIGQIVTRAPLGVLD